jgi:hypothetical protein
MRPLLFPSRDALRYTVHGMDRTLHVMCCTLRWMHCTLSVMHCSLSGMHRTLRGRLHAVLRILLIPCGYSSLKLHRFDVHQNGVPLSMDRAHHRGENPAAHTTIVLLHALSL